MKWFQEFVSIFYVPIIKINFSYQLSYISFVLWTFKYAYCSEVILSWSHTAIFDDVTNIFHWIFCKITFGQFQVKALFLNSPHQQLYMPDILVECFRKNQDAINVIYAKNLQSVPSKNIYNRSGIEHLYGLFYIWSFTVLTTNLCLTCRGLTG